VTARARGSFTSVRCCASGDRNFQTPTGVARCHWVPSLDQGKRTSLLAPLVPLVCVYVVDSVIDDSVILLHLLKQGTPWINAYD
jgi:hypothetical protein